jgi:hemerythrin-like domain-containing protein
MTPTDILREEHSLILEMLRVVGCVCEMLEASKPVDPSHLEMMVDFISGFADRCHHAKEEKLLFPAIDAAGTHGEGGPVKVMLAEHEIGRQYTVRMREAAVRYASGGRGAGAEFSENARGYITLLNSHIMKENNVLFNLADAAIPPEKMKALSEGFERVEREEIGEGVHEKYHEMLHSLRDKYVP